MINLYYTALSKVDKIAGNVFNIGGGMEQSMSLLELFDELEEQMGVKLEYVKLAPRISDQKIFVADNKKIKEAIGWEPKVKAKEGIRRMLEWSENYR